MFRFSIFQYGCFVIILTIHLLISLGTLPARENIDEIVGFFKEFGMQI